MRAFAAATALVAAFLLKEHKARRAPPGRPARRSRLEASACTPSTKRPATPMRAVVQCRREARLGGHARVGRFRSAETPRAKSPPAATRRARRWRFV